MNKIQVKVKKLDESATLPTRATQGSGCFDLHAVVCKWDDRQTFEYDYVEPGRSKVFRTCLTVEVPEGHVMLVFSRSGHGFNHGVRLSNCVGVIDSDYRGEIMVKLANEGSDVFVVRHGDRIAQAMIIPVPILQFVEVDELSKTERGSNGFGSTGS